MEAWGWTSKWLMTARKLNTEGGIGASPTALLLTLQGVPLPTHGLLSGHCTSPWGTALCPGGGFLLLAQIGKMGEMNLGWEKSDGNSTLDPLQWLQQDLGCRPHCQTHRLYKLPVAGSRPKERNFLKMTQNHRMVERFSSVLGYLNLSLPMGI